MKYWDNKEVLVGDKIVAFGSEGVVVYVIDTGQFSEKYPKGTWDYLENGMMVETVEMGLIHCPENDDRIMLIERASVIAES